MNETDPIIMRNTRAISGLQLDDATDREGLLFVLYLEAKKRVANQAVVEGYVLEDMTVSVTVEAKGHRPGAETKESPELAYFVGSFRCSSCRMDIQIPMERRAGSVSPVPRLCPHCGNRTSVVSAPGEAGEAT